MVEWHYVQDVRTEKVEQFCEKSMKKYPNRIYKIATARSNNPGMTAVYYREKYDRPTGVWKLHKKSCRFCKPKETTNKGLNQMKTGGGWFNTESYEGALALFNKDHGFNEYWQPCKECKPET